MRKLSIMMVVAMLLTTFAAMFVVPASAATATPAVPESVDDIALADENENYRLYTYASDAEAVANGAIGRFAKEGSNGYAKVWTAVGANARDCGSSVFLLLKDFNLNGSAERITFDLGGSGRTLVIDGSLGQARTGEMAGKNFEIKTNERAFHYNGASDGSRTNGAASASLTWQNVTFTSSVAKAVMQINWSLTMTFGDGFSLKAPLTTNNGSQYAVVVGGDCKMIVNDGATVDAGTDVAFFTNGSAVSYEINGGTLNAGRIIQASAGKDNTKVVVNGGTLNCSNYYAITFKAAKCEATINGGTINLSNIACYGAVMVEGAGATVTVNGGTVNGTYVPEWDEEKGEYKQYSNNCAVVNGYCTVNATINNVTTTGNVGVVALFANGAKCPDNSKVVINNATVAGFAVRATGGVGLDIAINGGTYASEIKDLIKWTYTTNDREIEATPGAINVNGGTFTALGDKKIITMENNGGGLGKTINVYGGTFNGYNTTDLYVGPIFDEEDNFYTYDVQGGNIYASAGQLNVYGGNFNLYSEGTTPATTGLMINAWASGNGAKVYGGNFVGGTAAMCNVAAAANGDGDVDGAYGNLLATVATGSYYIATNKGAALRTVIGEAGLRFESTVSADFVKFAGEDAVYGTLIVPADYLEATNGVFTKAALDAADKDYVEKVADKGLVENVDGSLTIRVALVNIKEGNKDRAFVAIAFAIVDGEYVYASENSGERSVDLVAKAALADVKATAEGAYTTAVTSYYVNNEGTFTLTQGTAYSKYTADQLTAIKSCVIAG